MVIGYMFNSQDAVTMASISIGSVFLFLSNLILPLETMSIYVQQAAKYNPYVICSELLKKLTLFESKWNDVYMEFIILGVYLVLVFILVLIVQKASKIQFISKKPITKQLALKDRGIDKYFKLKSGVLLTSEKDLLEELENMTDKDFEEYVTKRHNDFQSWLLMNKKTDLAKRIADCKTRKDMVAALKKYREEITPIAEEKK
jgi:Na+-transporting methylmalonyl-CoA/oxaloacetate decarboxylase gamma subunit